MALAAARVPAAAWRSSALRTLVPQRACGMPLVAAVVRAPPRRLVRFAALSTKVLNVPGVSPYGGKLMDLVALSDVSALKKEAINLPSLTLNYRQLCDIELLLNGSFSPLDGFMGKADYDGVCHNMRLSNGTLFPLPITLDVSKDQADKLLPSSRIALRDMEGNTIAILTVSDVWQPDRALEAKLTLGTEDVHHPGVDYLLNHTRPFYVGGRLDGIQLPPHYDYLPLRNTPLALREQFAAAGWNQVVGFQTRNPMHRAHRELTLRALQENSGLKLLVHPVVGMTKPGDIDHHTRVKCYKAIMPTFPKDTATLSLLNLAMRMGGDREALLHMIVRKNSGCTHFIVGRDHAGPGADKSGKDFYTPYQAQEAANKHADEIGIKVLSFQNMVYVPEKSQYFPEDAVTKGTPTLNISGTEQRRRLRTGEAIPEWFSFPAVVDILRKQFPPKSEQGVTLFFTGLSGSGKSTIANALIAHLLEHGTGDRAISMLDGDHVRTFLSSELGFSKEHRDLNIRRIGFVAAEVNKAGGLAICAPIAPYAQVRREVRQMSEEHGGFIEIYVATSLSTCEERDRKGLYAKARKGLLKGMTGIDDPYEEPINPEIRLDTDVLNVHESVDKVVAYLKEKGYLLY